MNQMSDCRHVLTALKNTSKGRLSYDRHWKEEQRTQEIMNDIKLKTSSLTISPKSLDVSINGINKTKSFTKYKVIESPAKETINSLNDKQNENLDKNDDSLRRNSFSHRSMDMTNDFELILYEKQRHESITQELMKKKQQLESEYRKCDEEFDEEMKLIRQKYALELAKKANTVAEDYKSLEESTHTKQLILKDKNSMNKDFKLKEIESKHKFLVEEQHRRQVEDKRRQLSIIRNEIDSVVKNCLKLSNVLENDDKNNQYFHILKQDLNSMIGLHQNIDILLQKHDLNDSDMINGRNFKIGINQIKDKIVSDINKLKQNSQNISTSKPMVQTIKIDEPLDLKSDSVSKFVDSNALKDYLKLQKFSNDFDNSFHHFVNEVSFKQKKNDLQLFVKTTINTISSESVEHIRDKLNRLTHLFSEKQVEYGGKQIKCNSKDGSLAFCISMASKMFISVSTKQKDIALTMAPIIVLLWSRFPTFGQIFLAQMQEKCPYLVPYYPDKDSDDNETNYLIACGYTIARDGTQESEESFLNRMRAMVKLYAAIIQSNLETGHPHSLKYAWIWTARLLNLEPRPAITAAVLESFISITSHKLYRFYGKQFIKLIAFIQNDYLKRIESVSQKGTKRQSLVKLQMFVDDLTAKINRRMSFTHMIPEGVVPDYFFSTSYGNSRGIAFK